MAFKRFIKKGRSVNSIASIWSRGQMGINKGAVKEFGLGDYSYVVLFFDKDATRIGIKFTHDRREEGALSLTHGQNGAIISVKAFLDFCHILYSKSKRYALTYDEESELYVIQLGKEDIK